MFDVLKHTKCQPESSLLTEHFLKVLYKGINRVTNGQKKKEIGNFFTALYVFSTVLIGLFTNAEAAHNLRKCLGLFYNLQVALSRHSMAKKTWSDILKLTPVR